MKYENRIVAFIDILGFRGLLSETTDSNDNDNEEAIDNLISAYASIREIWDLDKKSEILDVEPSTTKQVSIFSDCLVVSFEVNKPSAVFFTLLEIKWLIMRLISRKILCRGAISIGKMIHTNNYLFGPVLVEAYLLESKAAMYPRIILDNTLIEAGAYFRSDHHSYSQEYEYVESLLGQDSDGMYYVDYFTKAQTELDDPYYDFPFYIENLGDIIRKGLMGTSHHSKADVRVKYSWMREKFNNMVEDVTDKRVIDNLNESGEFELADFYNQLKKISPHKYNKRFVRTRKN